VQDPFQVAAMPVSGRRTVVPGYLVPRQVRPRSYRSLARDGPAVRGGIADGLGFGAGLGPTRGTGRSPSIGPRRWPNCRARCSLALRPGGRRRSRSARWGRTAGTDRPITLTGPSRSAWRAGSGSGGRRSGLVRHGGQIWPLLPGKPGWPLLACSLGALSRQVLLAAQPVLLALLVWLPGTTPTRLTGIALTRLALLALLVWLPGTTPTRLAAPALARLADTALAGLAGTARTRLASGATIR